MAQMRSPEHWGSEERFPGLVRPVLLLKNGEVLDRMRLGIDTLGGAKEWEGGRAGFGE